MGVEILTREQHVREPWRNGRGSTSVPELRRRLLARPGRVG